MSFFVVFCHMSTIEEIERAVEKLPQKDFAKLAAWMGQKAKTAGNIVEPATKLTADWVDIYMACPHSFKIPSRKKQFYRRKA